MSRSSIAVLVSFASSVSIRDHVGRVELGALRDQPEQPADLRPVAVELVLSSGLT